VCEGHAGTDVWFCDPGYIVHVRLEEGDDVFIESISTFTPTMGMDAIDGQFAQDAEDWVLWQALGRPSARLDVYGQHDQVPIEAYLQARGLAAAFSNPTAVGLNPKPWWRFWA